MMITTAVSELGQFRARTKRRWSISAIAFLFAVFGLVSFPVGAGETVIQPFTKGSLTEIRNEHMGKPFILAFWSESCAYCMKELAMFGRLIKKYPGVGLVTVATDPFLEESIVERVLTKSKLAPSKTWVFADNFVERLYADVDRNWRGELPKTYFFDAQHQMLSSTGMVKEKELLAWLKVHN